MIRRSVWARPVLHWSAAFPPTPWHSAGIGRTGVLITMETAMCLIERSQDVYPLDIVRTMRDQRAMMIQTAVSSEAFIYLFIFPFIYLFISQTRSRRSRRWSSVLRTSRHYTFTTWFVYILVLDFDWSEGVDFYFSITAQRSCSDR